MSRRGAEGRASCARGSAPRSTADQAQSAGHLIGKSHTQDQESSILSPRTMGSIPMQRLVRTPSRRAEGLRAFSARCPSFAKLVGGGHSHVARRSGVSPMICAPAPAYSEMVATSVSTSASSSLVAASRSVRSAPAATPSGGSRSASGAGQRRRSSSRCPPSFAPCSRPSSTARSRSARTPGETAATRSLANTAKLMAEQPLAPAGMSRGPLSFGIWKSNRRGCGAGCYPVRTPKRGMAFDSPDFRLGSDAELDDRAWP